MKESGQTSIIPVNIKLVEADMLHSILRTFSVVVVGGSDSDSSHLSLECFVRVSHDTERATHSLRISPIIHCSTKVFPPVTAVTPSPPPLLALGKPGTSLSAFDICVQHSSASTTRNKAPDRKSNDNINPNLNPTYPAAHTLPPYPPPSYQPLQIAARPSSTPARMGTASPNSSFFPFGGRGLGGIWGEEKRFVSSAGR
jgi:hypothetical protein